MPASKNVSRSVRACLVAALLVAAAVSVPGEPALANPPAGGACGVSSPGSGSVITGPVTITGTYSEAYQVVVAVNAGEIRDTHMSDPDGDDTGTWSYTFDPSSPQRYYGDVEVTVRCFSVDDRYYRWGAPVTLNVAIPGNQPPTVAVTSPVEGAHVSGTVPITVAASDPQGLASVQVRVDWGSWQTATPSGGSFVYAWPTAVEDKTHAVEARATDAQGNVTTTPTVYVKTGAGTAEPPAVRQVDRALWVWEPATYQLLENPGARTVLAQFMDDSALAPQPIRTLYLYADRYDGGFALHDSPDQYRSLISWAHSRGYQVHALLGSSSYMAPMLAYTRYHDKAVGLVETVLNYNIASAPAERFDGINVDIEPHGLPEWLDKPVVQLQYLDMLDAMMARKNAAGQNLNVGPAIPRWLDTNSECSNITWHGKTQNCARHVIDTVDYVSLMDYRDTASGPSGIIAHAQGEIDYAASVGKKVMVGVETDQISASGDPEKISFQEEGRTQLETELAQVYAAFGSSASFLGVAIHHFDADRVLPSVWSTSGTRWQSTVPDTVNPGTPTNVTASVFDWQRVDLHWSRSADDTFVDHYELHRSTANGFTPSPATLVRTSGSNMVKDWGLQPATTYYYRLVAVDLAGRKSAPSGQVSATTPAGVGLTPLRIASISFTNGKSTSTGTITVVNALTGAPVSGAAVFGHWEGAAGDKFDKNTASAGTASTSTESLTAPYTVIFVPERISAPGYYWAFSLDTVHSGQWNR